MSGPGDNRPDPSYITHTSDLSKPRFDRAWRSKSGGICAAVDVAPFTYFTFRSAEDARALSAACLEAAEAWERLAAETSDPMGEDGHHD